MTTPRISDDNTLPTATRFLVEAATINSHNDPGFVHARGEFPSRNTAAQFALTQASMIASSRGVDRVAVTITAADTATEKTATEIMFLGTPAETAVHLAGSAGYSTGVRRTRLPASDTVIGAIAEAVRSAPAGRDLDTDEVGVRLVEVHSVRPGDIPDSRTVVGAYLTEDAHAVAAALVEQLNGTLVEGRGGDDAVLQIRHDESSPDTAAAAARGLQMARLRANVGVLDPTADAARIEQINTDIDVLVGDSRRHWADTPVDQDVDIRPSRFLAAMRSDAALERTAEMDWHTTPTGDSAIAPTAQMDWHTAPAPYESAANDIGLN